MRVVFAAALLVLTSPALTGPGALAQTAPSSTGAAGVPAATTAPARGGDISRDEYIERAVERARRSAGARFDRMDTNHDGVLSADERRAAREERAERRAARRGQQQQEPQ